MADLDMFRILAQLDIFMYIKAYLEPMNYSGIFRTIDIFSQFQARYSGIIQEEFMHILNLFWQTQAYLELCLIYARNVSRIFRHFTKLHS